MSTTQPPIADLNSNLDSRLARREFLGALAIVSGTALATGKLAAAAEQKGNDSKEKTATTDKPTDGKKSQEPVPFNKQGTVLLDVDGKRVLLKTKVCLREGVLEMFCCLKQTKEHESILSIDAEAYAVHTALLALGANVGSPVKFQPEYSPAKGTRIRLFCQWTDKAGKQHREPAEKWVRNSSKRFFVEVFDEKPKGLDLKEDSELKWDEKNKELYWFGHMTEKQRDSFLAMSKDAKYRKSIQKFFDRTQPRQLDAPWVFAGSNFFKDETSGKELYLAEGGDLICVANFSSATIDLAVESSATGESNLMWEAWTDRLPPVGTEVLLELVPELDKKPNAKPAVLAKEKPAEKTDKPK